MSRMPPPLHTPTLQYATPVNSAVPSAGMWRKGNQLVLGRATILPQSCIKCARPEAKAFNRTAYWHPEWMYIMILFPGLLIYALIALIVRKKATYTCSLCTMHLKLRRRSTLIVWLLVLLGIATLVGSIVVGSNGRGHDNDSLTLAMSIAGLVLLLSGAIYGLVTLPLLRAKRIDEHYATYTGAGEEFLAPLGTIA